MYRTRCLFWYLIYLSIYQIREVAYLLLAVIFLTHIGPLLVCMGEILPMLVPKAISKSWLGAFIRWLGRFLKNASDDLAQKLSHIDMLEEKTKTTIEKIVDKLIKSGLFGQKINEVFVNLTKTLKGEDINLIGISLALSSLFTIVVYLGGTVILIIKAIIMMWRLF